jgi:L-lysine 2,3-aminomutase
MDDPSPRIAELFGVAQDSPEWKDWHWQYQHRVRDAESLSRVLDLREAERGEIAQCLKRFRMAATPYYLPR